MDLARLREETAPEHTATEDTVPLLSPGLDRPNYIETLQRFHRIVSAWDAWSDRHAPADLLPLLIGRRRADLLADDLISLGAAVPSSDSSVISERMESSAVAGDARSVFLGRMYVMEGSTLGGQYIARHVEETLGLTPGQGDSYFRGYREATGERWKEFRAVLAALPDEETSTVIASARNMFELFRDSMDPANAFSASWKTEPPKL
jgi:heme oxygenase